MVHSYLSAYMYKKICYVKKYPKDFDEKRKYPVIILLLGAGNRGTDIDLVRSSLFFSELEKMKLDTVVFAPQCYADSWFDIFEQLIDFVEYAIGHSYIDSERVYLIGSSMGGYATWQLAMTRPELFAAIVPICGGGMYWNAGRLKNLKIWAFHGSDDRVVFCDESKKMVEAVNYCGGDAKLTICEGVGHDSWINAYQSRELYDWLLEQRRGKYFSHEEDNNENRV